MTALRLSERIQWPVSKILSGTPIWAFDWDICCILDGCRVDTFRTEYPDARSYWSVASSSPTWVDKTFEGRDLSDVGYVTANPFSHRADPDRFGYFRQERVEQTEYGIETVTPERLSTVASRVWANKESHGIENLIVHFMQPHVPFRAKPDWFDQFTDTETWGSTRWDDVGGRVSRKEWYGAYRDNFQWVLSAGVEPLVKNITGTVGVTADHGNAMGEWGVYGHPRGVVTPAVRKVPWLTIDGHGNRENGGNVSEQRLSDGERAQQLAALGYRERP